MSDTLTGPEQKLLDRAPASWARTSIGRLIDDVSGGTPSKNDPEFWDGEIPWVSPKDMKRPVITDSIDHITEAALQRGGQKLLQPPAVLAVVRGMILAHTFPVAEIAAPVTINQDMKALVPRD